MKYIPNRQSEQNPNNGSLQKITRRDLLAGLLASVGTIGCAETFTKTALLIPTSDTPSDLVFHSAEEYSLLYRVADIIIPKTDTPGAISANVPALIDKLYAEWASEKSRIEYRQGLKLIKQKLNKLAGQTFLKANESIQLDCLQKLDTLAFSSYWQSLSPYRQLKELITRFYYWSEVGAKQELRYELVPGRWEACIPFKKVGKTWAA